MYSREPVFETDGAFARYHVSGSAPFVLGHYPSDPIFPGVMSLHGMETLCAMLCRRLCTASVREVVLKRISYLGIIRPGDVLDIRCRVKKRTTDELHLQADIAVEGTVKTKSTFIYRF